MANQRLRRPDSLRPVPGELQQVEGLGAVSALAGLVVYVPHEHAAVLGEAGQHPGHVVLQALLLAIAHRVLVELQHDLLALCTEPQRFYGMTMEVMLECMYVYRAVLPAGVVHSWDGQRLHSVMRVRAMAVVEENQDHVHVVAAGEAEEVVDALLEAAGVVAPNEVMQIHPQCVKTQIFCHHHFLLDGVGVISIRMPHFNLIYHKNISLSEIVWIQDVPIPDLWQC